MTLGHGVWLNEKDIDRLAETGPASATTARPISACALAWRALNRFEASGINTAIGLDEAGINDDRDMLQEMRWCCAPIACRGCDDDVPTMAQVLRMATVGRRQDDRLRRRSIGTLEVGKSADLVADRLASRSPIPISTRRRRCSTP